MATVPTTISRFQVLRSIGIGGMGTVYLASDPRIGNRPVAIKLLREGFDNPELRERFGREAAAAGQLRHVNIVTIFDVGEHEGQPFIAMEYIQGATLADLIQLHTALPLARKLQLMDELCAGLHFAHQKGVIHRDIKPGNVMLDEDGVLKILDFGIARLGASGMTQAGMVMGTLNYMAPEQLEGKPVDTRADIFAAGALFYELLTYRRAFPGELPEIVHQILSGKPDPLERLIPHLDGGLAVIVNRCLEKQPNNRYPDLAAVRRDLAMIQQRITREEQIDRRTTIPSPALLAEGFGSEPVPTPRSGRRETNREELLRIRAEQIQGHVGEARRALDRADFSAVLRSSQQALVLDPENAPALELEDRARAALEQLHIQEWLKEARGDLDRGALTAASLLVERALSLNSSSPEANAIRKAVDEARRHLAEREEHARKLENALAHAQQELDAGSFEAALTSVDQALRIDAASDEAKSLKARIIEGMVAKRRGDEEKEAGRVIVEKARQQFGAGDHAGALEMLESFQPTALVADSLGELRLELRMIERLRLDAARRQQEDERRVEAERAARVQQEIAQKLADASARLKAKDLDGARSLVRAVLALEPRQADALALQTTIEDTMERHEHVTRLIVGARALVDREKFTEAIDAIAAVAEFDPQAPGLTDLRRAVASGLRTAETAEQKRREAAAIAEALPSVRPTVEAHAGRQRSTALFVRVAVVGLVLLGVVAGILTWVRLGRTPNPAPTAQQRVAEEAIVSTLPSTPLAATGVWPLPSVGASSLLPQVDLERQFFRKYDLARRFFQNRLWVQAVDAAESAERILPGDSRIVLLFEEMTKGASTRAGEARTVANADAAHELAPEAYGPAETSFQKGTKESAERQFSNAIRSFVTAEDLFRKGSVAARQASDALRAKSTPAAQASPARPDSVDAIKEQTDAIFSILRSVESAYERKAFAELKALWPNNDFAKKLSDSRLRSAKLKIRPTVPAINLATETAQVPCLLTFTYDWAKSLFHPLGGDEAEQKNQILSLKRQGDRWVIVNGS